MGSKKERGKGGSYVKIPYLTLPFSVPPTAWACDLTYSPPALINEKFLRPICEHFIAFIEFVLQPN